MTDPMGEPIDLGVGVLICNGCGSQLHALPITGMTGYQFRQMVLAKARDDGWTRGHDANGALDWCPACTLARKAATN